jgi:hypothetical protein
MEKASSAGLHGRLGKHSRRIHTTGLKLSPSAPITDLRRAVKHSIDSSGGRRARHGIGQITAHDLDAQTVEKIGSALRANQSSDVATLGSQALGHVTAQ